MSIVFEPLRTAGVVGRLFSDPEANVRYCFPLYAAHLADNPEQTLISCVPKRRSPISTASSKDLDSPVPKPRRTREYTLRKIRVALKKRGKTESLATFVRRCRKMDLNGVTKPFWEFLPHADPSSFLACDILHQLHRFFLDHPFKWIQKIVGEAELDKRVSAVQHIIGIKHFNGGVSKISQWTCREHRELQRVILACAAGAAYVTPTCLAMLRSILDAIYLAQYPSHNAETMQYLLDAVKRFHATKSEVLKIRKEMVKDGVKGLGGKKKAGLPRQPSDFQIPKLEMLHNLVPCILELGSLEQFSTEITEFLHGPLVQHAFEHGNGRNATANMCRFLDRREKVQNFQEFLDWRRRRLATKGSGEDVDSTSSDDGPDEASRSYSFTKKPSLSQITVESAAIIFGIPDLRAALADFYKYDIDASQPERGTRRISRPDAVLPFDRINVWYRLRLTAPAAADDENPTPTTVCASPPSADLPSGLFNTILYHDTDAASTAGIEGEPPFGFCS
jgi:hypothetical protein